MKISVRKTRKLQAGASREDDDMRNIPERYRKWGKVFCAVLIISSLLLTGCAAPSGEQKQTQPPETTTAPEVPEVTTAPPVTEPEPPSTELDDPSLSIFRQAMVETPQLFAAAYFGYVPQDADPFAVMQDAAPQLCEDLPFLLTIRDENVIGASGYLFCIVPADENAAVAVNRRPWNPEAERYEEPEVLYRSENGSPILVMCLNEDWIPDTEVIITDSNGTTAVWSPYLEPSYCISTLRNDSGESLIFDFTSYDELPNPGWNQGIDSSELVGTWELAWTEVEGDRNKAESGVSTIVITPDETGCFRFTYVSRDFPGENIQDRELLIVPGELYWGCGNDLWIGEVTMASGDNVQYALTLLEDGTLLLQNYWEMDGMPWVSYGWYQRID